MDSRRRDDRRTATEPSCDRSADVEVDSGYQPITCAPSVRAVYAKALRAAAVDSSILITGESGTGKEVLARTIHGARKNSGRFVPINCGSIPDSLIETELYGYRRGAFTGANTNTVGLVEQAAGGTLFLDEIGDMPLALQVHLLRFLDSGEVRSIGDAAIRHVRVCIVAATNRDIELEIAQGRFRQDLFFRLAVVTLRLPPLRERREDIPTLINHYLASFASKFGRPAPVMTAEAMRMLVEFDWPGNIRELKNVVEQAVIYSEDGFITPAELPPSLSHSALPAPYVAPDPQHLAEVLASLARGGITHVQAAAALGISRTTLWRHLRKLERLNGASHGPQRE